MAEVQASHAALRALAERRASGRGGFLQIRGFDLQNKGDGGGTIAAEGLRESLSCDAGDVVAEVATHDEVAALVAYPGEGSFWRDVFRFHGVEVVE